MPNSSRITRQIAALAAFLLLVLVACADTAAVEAAAESFVAPASWTLEETETLNGAQAVERRLVYASNESRDETCAKAAQALAAWAEVDVTELTGETTDLGCRFNTDLASNTPGETISGSVRIFPLRVDGVAIEDPSQPGGTGIIWFNATRRK